MKTLEELYFSKSNAKKINSFVVISYEFDPAGDFGGFIRSLEGSAAVLEYSFSTNLPEEKFVIFIKVEVRNIFNRGRSSQRWGL